MIKRREIITVLGGTGSGKSFLIKNRILPSLTGRLVFIVDRLGEYNFGVVSESIGGFAQSLREPNASGVYTLQTSSTEEAAAAMIAAWEAGEVWLILDEVDGYSGHNSIMPELSKLITLGRHRAVSIVAAARRPSEVHPSIRAQSDLLVSFVQREPRDRAVLMQRSDDFSSVAELGPYCYIAHGNSTLFSLST